VGQPPRDRAFRSPRRSHPRRRAPEQPLAVTLQADGFTLRSDQPLSLGDHLLEIETTLADRAGRPLEPRFDAAFTWDGTTEALAIFKAESDTTPTNLLRRSRADKDLIADLTGLNLGFQGQPYDPETGLYYFRNRYYDPELGRFITADPLGYVDGPSLYAFAGNDPVNGRDPLGLCFGVDDLSCWAWYVAYLKALGQTAGELARALGGAIHGTADFATLGSLSSLSAQFEILRTGEGTLEERSRQAALAGIQARLDVVSLGFASAPDRAAHGRSIVSSALGLDEQSEGARQIAEACFVASEPEACILAATRWGGGASKTVLFLASLGRETTRRAGHLAGPEGRVAGELLEAGLSDRLPALPRSVGAAGREIQLRSRIAESPFSVRHSKSLGQAAQRDVDSLLAALRAGNPNPGIGTRALGDNFFELRGANAGRVIVKQTGTGAFDIVAKFQGHLRGDAANSALIERFIRDYKP
jgi:RHS repeat-associated protein